MDIFKKIFPVILVLVFSYFSFKPLLGGGFFPIHDDTQVARVFEMTKSLGDIQFPVRWVSDLGYGYGYPIFNYYDPLPYYVGGIIGLFSSDPLLATKLVFLFGIIFSGISMYFLAKEFWGVKGGILSSIFYVYAPYHAVDIYVRGDAAELWAYAFIPLLFLGVWKIYKEAKWRHVILSSVSFALIITSHNLTAMMVSPFLLLFTIFLLINNKQKKTRLYLLLSLVLGVVLSAFYWIPAIFELNYTNVFSQIGGGADFRNHFVCIQQLWTSTWGYGGSVQGCADGLSFMIGKFHILFTLVLSIISGYAYLSDKYKKIFNEEKLNIILISFFGLLMAVFFTLEISRPVWEIVKPMEFFQYPWRFLIMVAFFASLISGSALWYTEKLIKVKYINFLLSLILFLFMIFVSIKFFVPQEILNRSSSFYVNNYALNWVASKTSDEYMPRGFQKPKNSEEVSDFSKLNSPSLKIIALRKNSNSITLNYFIDKEKQVVLPLAYFPAWRGYLDGQEIKLSESGKGTAVNLLGGQHDLELKFKQTPLESAANIVSLAGILSLFAGIIRLKRKYE